MIRDLAQFRAAYHSSAASYDNTAHLTTCGADIPWISGGDGEQWLYVDLGAASRITAVSVQWGESFAGLYEIELSDDGVKWTAAAVEKGAAETAVETKLSGEAKYLRILCKQCSGEHYIIRKLQVMGENDFAYKLPPAPVPSEDGTQKLNGANWRLCRAFEVTENGSVLSDGAFDDNHWLAATVPGTALMSYINAGAVPNPDYDDWQFQISEAYFTADFWYRNHFTVPENKRGQRVFLNFDAINWKADVYFNGAFLENANASRKSSIEGAFIRASFDVTQLVRYGEENYLAVLIHKNDTPGKVTTQGLAFGPGSNGGLLGADNPTLHASVGWDWLPTIRGRNIGIYGDVSLSYGGAAGIIDPWIETKLDLIGEQSALPCENLVLRRGVLSQSNDWQGSDGEGFTVDFGEELCLGSAQLIWGSEAGGAAADVESRHPEQFRLETSVNGTDWVNFDFYPGGEVDAQWFGMLKAEPNAGSATFEGHAVSDSVQGGTAIVAVDMSMFGLGVAERRFFMPQRARYLRFTVLERRKLNQMPVDTRVKELRVYAESPEQVEQNTRRMYLLDTTKATVIYRADIKNRGASADVVEIRGKIMPGGVEFAKTLKMAAGETLPVEVPIVLENPRLWWPNTYGEQFLYTAETELYINGVVSDRKEFSFGVRRFDYPTDGGLMTLYCNGARIVAKGGNWGIDDGMKRDTAQVLNDKIRLHAEANMTMIRNWVGMTNHQGFYDACDKYGVLIWDDFWLANPVDGPEPNDPDMFLDNAADKIRRVRSHAALCLYCGRNEGNPNAVINSGLDTLTKELDGTRVYIPNSAAPPVGSGGGYSLAVPGGQRGVKQYFDDVSSPVLRSERGIPNVPALESLQKFLKPENVWPINEVWALHDWTYHMNGPANSYMSALQTYLGGDFEIPIDRVQGGEPKDSDPVYQQYKADIAKMCREAGEAWTIEDFSRAAQLINYDNHRGLFDALATRRANGLLMWMSQSSWPSFMWQTYDFYLDTNGGYYGAKAGNQPVRAVFDPRNDSIILANATAGSYENVVTTVEIFDLSGKSVFVKEYKTELLEADAYGVTVSTVDFSAAETDLVFLRLTLSDKDGAVLGSNTYWHNRREYQNYRGLNKLPMAAVTFEVSAKETVGSDALIYTLKLKNGAVPAMGVRLRLLREDGSAVLPVFYSDNYLTMMPGESRIITAECDMKRLGGEAQWEISGWNVKGTV